MVPSMPMQQKVCLVTGCSSGIGATLARELAAAGHQVYAGVRNMASCDLAGNENLTPLELDVNDAGQVLLALKRIEEEWGRLDILVNNAGYGAMGPMTEVPLEQIRRQFETNVFAPINLAQGALPLLQEAGQSIVVNIGSAAGVFTVPFSGVYNASKAALHAMSDVMRMELAHSGVHVMTVLPGGVASTFGDNAASKLAETLAERSRYASALPAIERRARVSSSSSTTPEMFCRKLIAAMLSEKPPARICIGQGSRLMLLMNVLLPTNLRERLMRRAYGLHQLA
jgi:NAD(P)-dependent dehydrogenase (short-subunit alcohol dehydrogenase family)